MLEWKSPKTIWVLTIASSLVVAAITGFVSTKRTLQGRIDEGRVLFGNIGLRYFDALLLVHYEPGQQPGTSPPSPDPRRWQGYRSTLNDVLEDIRSLRTNPLYIRVQGNTRDLVFVQNRIASEVSMTGVAANSATLHFMCNVFVHSGELKEVIGEDEVSRAIYDFAVTNCPENSSAS